MSAPDDQRYLLVCEVGINKPENPISSGRILRARLDGSFIEPLVSGQRLPDCVVTIQEDNHMYWTAMGIPGVQDGALWRSDLDGSNARVILAPGEPLVTPKQLCFDTTARKLYICDRDGLKIVRCNLDGSECEILVRTGDTAQKTEASDPRNACVGITIDQAERMMYWTQKGGSKASQGRIFRAKLDSPEDPANRIDIECVAMYLPEPIDLAIDPVNRSLYWTDRGEFPHGNTLNRCRLSQLSGKDPLICNPLAKLEYDVLARNLHEAIGLALDVEGQKVWVADLGGTVYRVDLSDGRKTRMYEELEGCFAGVALV